jgi:hypothetical protein
MDFIHGFVGPNSEWFWVMIQSLVIGVTLVYATVQLRIQSRTNLVLAQQLKLQSQAHVVNAFAVMNDRWRSAILLQARICFCRDYAHDARRISPAIAQVAMFFEEMGTYCRKGVLDAEIVWELYSFEIEHYWVMSAPAVRSFRREKNDRSFYRYFEILYDQMLAISKNKGVPSSERIPDEVKDFIKVETETVDLLRSILLPMQLRVVTGAEQRDIPMTPQDILSPPTH